MAVRCPKCHERDIRSRIADSSTSCCGASAWCPCAATSANTASSGSARASAPDPLRGACLSLCLLSVQVWRRRRGASGPMPMHCSEANPTADASNVQGRVYGGALRVERGAGTGVEIVASRRSDVCSGCFVSGRGASRARWPQLSSQSHSRLALRLPGGLWKAGPVGASVLLMALLAVVRFCLGRFCLGRFCLGRFWRAAVEGGGGAAQRSVELRPSGARGL